MGFVFQHNSPSSDDSSDYSIESDAERSERPHKKGGGFYRDYDSSFLQVQFLRRTNSLHVHNFIVFMFNLISDHNFHHFSKNTCFHTGIVLVFSVFISLKILHGFDCITYCHFCDVNARQVSKSSSSVYFHSFLAWYKSFPFLFCAKKMDLRFCLCHICAQ